MAELLELSKLNPESKLPNYTIGEDAVDELD